MIVGIDLDSSGLAAAEPPGGLLSPESLDLRPGRRQTRLKASWRAVWQAWGLKTQDFRAHAVWAGAG